MQMKLATGVQSFERIRNEKLFFVDKTSFIKEWWERKDDITLITRPRRFGKTLNMSMLDCFFSLQYVNRDDLFEGLSIWEEEEYRQLQGTYPVINLSFATVKCTDYESVCKLICQTITNAVRPYADLKNDMQVDEADRRFLKQIDIDMPNHVAIQSLQVLSSVLESYYGKKVIVLLDEYDTPLIEAYTHGYWKEMTEFMRGFFNATFKSNPSLYRGVMTGITRISKESMFSDLNNLKVCTTTSKEYATCFGFTEEEVFASLDTYGYREKKEAVKRWYDGFIFGNQKDMYNPWSIINFLVDGKLDSYWVNTSGNALVNQLIQQGSSKIKEQMEDLLIGKSIFVPIDEEIVYNQLDATEEAIWSLLLASGYLKVLQVIEEDTDFGGIERNYELALTNVEVIQMFAKFVKGWFHKPTVEGNYNEFVRNLLQNNIKKMNTFMNKVALETISSFDTGTKPSEYTEPERFYHGFVLGLLVELKPKYEVLSNRESGYGRYDVMIVPKNKTENAYVFEFKVLDPDEEQSLEDTVQAAMQQIEEKKYVTSLVEKGIPKENIYCYGFAFEGKKVLIGE
ncbi:MAG: AAA family ATPase [Lachnospiraceae bacterium]|nr:AAA family ATPase [Lachnospiraceae bacterium]